jgi:hypothetical protein
MTILAASRMTSYYDEDAAREVAKLVPIALLGVFIVDPTYFSLDVVIQRFYSLPNYIYLVLQYLVYIVFLEFVLRILFNIRHHPIFKKKEKYSA